MHSLNQQIINNEHRAKHMFNLKWIKERRVQAKSAIYGKAEF